MTITRIDLPLTRLFFFYGPLQPESIWKTQTWIDTRWAHSFIYELWGPYEMAENKWATPSITTTTSGVMGPLVITGLLGSACRTWTGHLLCEGWFLLGALGFMKLCNPQKIHGTSACRGVSKSSDSMLTFEGCKKGPIFRFHVKFSGV